MYTFYGYSTTTIGQDYMFKFEQEMRLRNFSKKTIKAYVYYNKELLRFANNCILNLFKTSEIVNLIRNF